MWKSVQRHDYHYGIRPLGRYYSVLSKESTFLETRFHAWSNKIVFFSSFKSIWLPLWLLSICLPLLTSYVFVSFLWKRTHFVGLSFWAAAIFEENSRKFTVLRFGSIFIEKFLFFSILFAKFVYRTSSFLSCEQDYEITFLFFSPPTD